MRDASAVVDQALQRARRKPLHAQQRGRDQRLRLGRARRRLERALAPQHREHRLGDERPLLLAELAVLAEVARQQLVGRTGELQHLAEHRFRVPEQPAREPHGAVAETRTAT